MFTRSPRGTASMTALALSLAFAATPARAQDASTAELRQQIDALQRQVEQIERREAASADVSRAQSQVLDDANRRSQLLQSGGVTSGYDGSSFFLSSSDGKFTLKPLAHFQVRNATVFREGAAPDGEDDWQNGFEIRRMKLGARGNLFDKNLTYLFIWGARVNSGTIFLDEAWARYKFDNGLAVRAGQFKDPLNRESQTPSHLLLSCERSYQTDLFFGMDNYVQGISLSYEDAALPVKGEVAFTDGAISTNGNFQDPPTGVDQNFGVAGRVDYKAFGDWKTVGDFAAARVETDTLAFGAGIDYTEGEQLDAGTKQVIRYTADGIYKLASNWSFYAAVNGRHTEVKGGANSNDWGALAQVAWSPDDKIEPFVRYGYSYFDSAAAGSEASVHEITAGVNHYLHGQNAKLTLDLTYLPNGAPYADSGADILLSQDAEVVLRAQFQLAL